MATKIRLQRGGRKGYAFYRIVVADSRAPRDGKFIEKIGTYNPNTNPATVELDFERALYWVNCGAQPTDTARTLLSSKGVYLMKHLLGGVAKGAFDKETALKKLDEWKEEKNKKNNKIKTDQIEERRNNAKQQLEQEKKQNLELKAKIQEKLNAKQQESTEESTEEQTEEK